MAGPITWRTIYGQTPDAAARLMQTAQSSFNQGFETLGNVLKKEQETNQQNWDNTKKNNTNEYLDKLAQYRSLDELQAAQASGELDRLKQGYGYQIDAGAVRDADNTRIDLLRERATKANEFADQTRIRNERESVNDFYSDLYAGKVKEARQRLLDNQYMNEGELAQALYSNEKDRRGESREDTRLGYEGARVQMAREAAKRASTEFGWREQDRREQEAIERAGAQTFLEIQANERRNWDQITSLGKEIGIPLDSRGFPDVEKAGPIQKAAYQHALKQAGLENTPSSTMVLNKSMESLINTPGVSLSPAQLQGFRQGLTGLLEQSESLLPAEQKQLDTGVEQITQQTVQKIKSVQERQAKELTANPFAAGPFNAEEGVSEALSALPKDFDPMGVNSSQREMLAEKVYTALQNGVPPAVAKMIVERVGDSWAITDDIDDFFDKELKKLQETPKYAAQLKEAATLREKHQQEVAEIQEKSLREISKLTVSARKNSGQTPGVSQNFLKTLEKELNKTK